MIQPLFASVDVLDDALLTCAPPLAPQSPARPPPAPGTAGVAPMAPGVGGFNIDLPSSHDAVEEVAVAIQGALQRSSLNDPEPGPRPPKKIETAVAVWIGRASFIWNMLLIMPIIGFLTLAPRDDPFLRSADGFTGFGGSRPYSEATAEIIDAEVERILQECYASGYPLRGQIDRNNKPGDAVPAASVRDSL